MSFRAIGLLGISTIVCFCSLARAQQNPSTPPQQKISKDDRDSARDMFAQIGSDVKKHYYDPNFHGVDWAAVTQSTEQAIDNSASLNRALSEIAAGLDKLNDSHTFFLPPSRPYTMNLGGSSSWWAIIASQARCGRRATSR